MELHQLETFRTVAKTLSFTRAAAGLNYAQSTVSAQIQALEEELGVTLFDRLGRRVNLTAAGVLLLEYAERLLSLAAEAQTRVSGQDGLTGSLTISAPETLCTYRLPEVLRRFRSRFPHVQLIIGYSNPAELLDQLGKGLVDIGFLIGEPLRRANLVVEALVEEPLLVVAQPEHRLARLPLVEPEELARETLLLTEAGCAYRLLFERVLASAGVQPVSRLEFHSVGAIKQSAIAGLGLAVLPEVTVAAEIAWGQLVRLNLAGPEMTVVTQVYWHKDKWLSPTLSALLELVREVVSESASQRVSGQQLNGRD
jgi:DNA-binding transcriptional LysR family regulator